jgi:mannitol-1-phosphate/altronate dehydrogenase
MHRGSQDDVALLDSINAQQGYFDIIIDDGGHSMKQQITSFTHLFAKVRHGGVYIIEDLQTSYFNTTDSGYLVKNTTIELIKRLVDDIQVDSIQKSTELGDKLFSFEISNRICFFTKK